MNKIISQRLNQHREVLESIINDEQMSIVIDQIIDLIVDTFKKGNKVMFCGNGGSAADAQHLATELSGKFYLDRPPLDAEALHVNSSFITAVANDIGYFKVFVRALCAKAKAGDLLIAMSTSGNSENVINAINKAKEMQLKIVSLTGANGQNMAALSDVAILVPSTDTPRIQEMHMLIGHIVCEAVEATIFKK